MTCSFNYTFRKAGSSSVYASLPCDSREGETPNRGRASSSLFQMFPDPEIQPLSQRYTRIAKHTYRYESDTGFSAEIVVDDLGLVIT